MYIVYIKVMLKIIKVTLNKIGHTVKIGKKRIFSLLYINIMIIVRNPIFCLQRTEEKTCFGG